MNPGACSASQVCNQQTAMCQDAPKAAAWSVDAGSGKLAPSDLNKVWGSSAQDVWAVGLQGAIVHYEVAPSRHPAPAFRPRPFGADT
jgi:hypothetical protein